MLKKLMFIVAAACSASVICLSACSEQKESVAPGEYTIDATLSCYVTAMGGIEFGAPLLESANVSVDEEGESITLNLTSGQITIYSITCDIFVDAEPDTSVEKGLYGVEEGTIGYYDDDGNLITENVTYTFSEDTVLNTKGEYVRFVNSITFPVTQSKSTYKLALYINSNVMGLQFCEPNATATANGKTTYSATLTLDWDSLVSTGA